MQHRSTPLVASYDANIPSGPSLRTICMLQMLARTYKPDLLKNGRLDKHALT